MSRFGRQNIVIGIAEIIPAQAVSKRGVAVAFSSLEIRWESDILLNLD
jgi:hypothetical protein